MKSTMSWLSYAVLLSGFSTLALDMIMVPQCGRVTCSQGNSTCTVEDILLPMDTVSGSEAIWNLGVQAKLCCTSDACSPCILISIQLNSSLVEDEESDYKENLGVWDQNDNANVMVCYSPVAFMPACKNIHFNITAATAPEAIAQLSLVVCEPKSVLFSSEVSVNVGSLHHMVKVPSVDEVCSTEHQGLVEACDAPRIGADIDQIRGVVNLSAEHKSDNFFPLKMCLKQERNGACKKWTEKAIPLHSVSPCMCIQMWWDKVDERSHRSESCPFKKTEGFQRNVWANVSVSVVRGQMNSGGSMLSWNVSTPCRLEAEVWLCQRDAGVGGCREQGSSRQPLSNGPWMENRKGLWQVQGAFEDIESHVDLCMMVKIQGMDKNIGPFCPNVYTSRWRMSLLVLVIVLLIGIAVLGICFLHSTVKHAGGEGHIMLLSPPDAEGPVSEQVCELGSLLVAQGFRVCVDLWSRAQLGSLGPLPWLHSQLHLLDTQGGRVLVVLTRSAWERAHQWGQNPHQQGHFAQARDTHTEESGDKDRDSSPYTDVFSACLSCIHADRQQGCVEERFTLVTFESHPARPATGSKRGLPELLQGLPWFHLPSQSQGLLSALSGGRRGVRRRRTERLKGGLSSSLQGYRRDSQSGQPYQWVYSDVIKTQEAGPLQHVLSTKST
ncbi:interleukin-17 receptor C-like isoform X3 [Hypomesus transpacificus]|uniref:interleukin-17 receptor C-like isoform X3 n=1 Tax=Hypomesus transpacificus TaxID=137520 RepID=UPI001F078551|nr:interleukin-17 receptor C-like isoform X3 [Hypomesus transpacificus]